MLERDVEKEIRIYAEGRGMIAIKLSGPGNRGKPDRLLFYRGRVLIMEVKRPGEEPTEKQHKWLTTFKDADFDAVWADRPGLGKTLIDKFIAKTDAETDLLKRLFNLMRGVLRRFRIGQTPAAAEVEYLALALEEYTGTPEDF